MSDRDLSASPPLSEQQVEQIRAFILTHGTRSLPSKAKVRDLCDSHERLRAQVSTLTDRAASSDVEAWGVFQDGVACVVAFPYQTRAEEFAARQADDALGAHTYTVAPLVRASTRSRRSEQEADALISDFWFAADAFRRVSIHDQAAFDEAQEKYRSIRAALRTALVEPSTDAGESVIAMPAPVGKQWFDEREARVVANDCRSRIRPLQEIEAVIEHAARLLDEFAARSDGGRTSGVLSEQADRYDAPVPESTGAAASSATDAGEDARRAIEVARDQAQAICDHYENGFALHAANLILKALPPSARAAAPGVSPEVSND